MRKIWTITWLHLKGFFRSPAIWVLMFAMPVLFSFIFGGISANSGKTKPLVNIVDNGGDTSKGVINLLKKNDQFTWKKVSLEQARKNVSAEDALAAVVIPADMTQRVVDDKPLFDVILLRKTENYYALQPQLQGTANLIVQSYQAAEMTDKAVFPKLLEAVAANESVKVEKKVIQKDANSKISTNLMFVGFAVMFMMFGLSGASSAILDERIGGTWGRLLVTPASKLQISLGYLLSYFLLGWVQLAVLMTAMNLMFGAGWGKLTYLIPFASLVIVCVVGFGLMIAGLVKTKPQASSLGAVLIVSTCMLGGLYWPLDIVPPVMQKIALAVPQSWAMSGFKEIISGSLNSGVLLKDTLALLGFTVLFYGIGLRGIKFE